MSHLSNNTGARIDGYLQRAYALGGTADAQDLYDEWAGIYDVDNDKKGYFSPQRCVEAMISHINQGLADVLKIFDAGCGTGLVGDCLAQSALADHFILDGVDISKGMLEEAKKKGVYQNLNIADLNERIPKPDCSYDIVVCVGTLTKGHVGPKVLAEFSRITTSLGLIVATVHVDVWESEGYRAEVERLRDVGMVQILGTEEFGILKEANTGGRMVVLRKN